MDYFANVEAVVYFVRVILPHISRVIPDVKFYVVGSNPAEELHALAKDNPNIFVTGYVDQVQPYMAKAAVFVAPMRIARGVQNKILEAMAMGVPVVTSSLGHEGISAVPGRDIYVEDLPERFADRVAQLMLDSKLRLSISINSRNIVEKSYDWSTNLTILDKVLVGS
jgi:glycosyltransferase involved in cell wall biosynthesis